MMADAVSKNSNCSFARFTTEERPMVMNIQILDNQGVQIDHIMPCRLLASMVAQSSFDGQVKAR